MTSTTGCGQLQPGDAASPYNALRFVIETALGRVRTALIVEVKAVAGGGDAASPPTVDVLPLVNMLDGNNNSVKHGTIYGMQVMRMQSGTNALIIDPIVGDIGIALILDRDSSAVFKAARNPQTTNNANPGSLRHHDLADGIYIGGILGKAPKQTIQITAAGIILGALNSATSGNFAVGTGASGSFMTPTGQTVTVQNGIIINIF